MNQYNENINWLQPDEKIVWQGRPLATRIFTKNDLYLIPINIFFIWSVLNTYLNYGLDLILAMFFVLVFYLAIGRYIHKYFKKKDTIYYITDKRVVIIDDRHKKMLQEMEYSKIKKIEKSIGKNGIGNLTFGTPTTLQMFQGDTGFEAYRRPNWSEPSGPTPAFYGIEDCETVYQLVCELKNTSINT